MRTLSNSQQPTYWSWFWRSTLALSITSVALLLARILNIPASCKVRTIPLMRVLCARLRRTLLFRSDKPPWRDCDRFWRKHSRTMRFCLSSATTLGALTPHTSDNKTGANVDARRGQWRFAPFDTLFVVWSVGDEMWSVAELIKQTDASSSWKRMLMFDNQSKR